MKYVAAVINLVRRQRETCKVKRRRNVAQHLSPFLQNLSAINLLMLGEAGGQIRVNIYRDLV